MKNMTIILAVAVSLALAAGCDNRPTPPEDPTVYDPGVDGSGTPSLYTIDVDPRLAGDQGSVAREARKAAGTPAAPTTPPVTPGGPTPPVTPGVPTPPPVTPGVPTPPPVTPFHTRMISRTATNVPSMAIEK